MFYVNRIKSFEGIFKSVSIRPKANGATKWPPSERRDHMFAETKNPLLKGLSEPLWKMYEPETASYDENKCGVRQPLESRPLGKK